MDYITEKGVPNVFTIELSPGRFSADVGFVLPASQIVPVAKANWEGLKALATNLAKDKSWYQIFPSSLKN